MTIAVLGKCSCIRLYGITLIMHEPGAAKCLPCLKRISKRWLKRCLSLNAHLTKWYYKYTVYCICSISYTACFNCSASRRTAGPAWLLAGDTVCTAVWSGLCSRSASGPHCHAR